MLEFIEDMLTPYNIFSTIIGILGILFTIITFAKSKKKIDFDYQKKTFNLINGSNNKFPDLEIKFAGQRIKDFSVTQIALWNCGNKTIEKNDLASSGNLKITSTDDSQILTAAVINYSDINNDISIQNEGNMININFEYLDPKQGASIQVLHTGRSSNLILSYTLKGSKNKHSNYDPYKINKYISKLNFVTSKAFKSLYLILSTFIMFIAFLLGALSYCNVIPKSIFYSTPADDRALGITTIIMTLLSGLLFASAIFISRSRVPKELQTIESLLELENAEINI